jgi:Skp family chaperone for outer membrane proteins
MSTIIKWIKDNWATLVVFTIVLVISVRLKGMWDESNIEEVKHQYADQMQAQQKSHDAQIKELNKINDEALAKQKEIGFQYQKQLEDLQQQFDEKILELEDLKKAKVKELTKQLTDDPEIAVQDIAMKFGLTVVVVPPEPDEVP